MDKKKLFITIIISGLAFLINYLISFFLTSYVTDNISIEANGFISLAKTFATYATIATTALNSYSSRYITLEYHKGNMDKANIYFNSVLFGNFGCGTVLVFACAMFTVVIDKALNVPGEIVYDVRLLFILVFINLFVSLTSTAFQSAAIIKNKLIHVSIFKGCSYFIEAVTLLVIFSFLPPHVYFVGVGMILATLFISIAYYMISRKYTPELKISISYFKLSAIKELVVNGLWNSINSLGNTLNSGLDLLVSNSLLSALAMGQVSIVKTMVSIFSNLYQMIAQPFEPILLKNYANDKKDELISWLKLAMKISGLISNLAFAGVVSFGLCYYKLWVPNQNCLLLYRLTMIAVASSIFEGAVFPLYYIYTLTVKNKVPCIITIIGGVLNVLGMYILIKNTDLSVYSVFITTAVIMLFINGVTNPIYMSRCLKLPWTTFYPELIRHVISCTVMTIAFMFISKILNPYSWITLILAVLICCVVGLLIHVLVVFDFNDIKDIIRQVVKN